MLARRRWPAWLLALTVGLAAVLPLLSRGPSCGQDFDFHLQSWLAVHAAWHARLWAPHWVAGANYGAGELRFVFYPPLSWLLGAGLGVVLPWAWVPAAFTGVCFAGAAGAMQRVARDWCSPTAAALAGVLYALSPYLLFTGYERAAYGELLAGVWMPLLLGALLAARLPVGRAAVLLAALWYTNAPAGVVGCYLMLFTVLWRGAEQWAGPRDARPRRVLAELARGAAALGLGCGLAADYLLPAWYEQRFVSIARAVGPGMRVEDSFLFGRTGEAYHDQVLRTASWIVVWIVAVALAAGVVVLVKRLRGETGVASLPAELWGESRQSRSPAAFLLALVGLCGLLQLRWSDWIWHLLPEFAFLQFPWRLMLPVGAAGALLVGMALGRAKARLRDDYAPWSASSDGAPRRPRRRLRAALALAGALYAVGLVAWAAQTRYQPCDEEDNVQAQLALPGSGPGFEGTDEYAAAGSDNGEIQRGLPRVRLLRSPDAEEGDDSAADAANPTWRQDPQAAVSGTVRVEQWGPERFTVRLHPDADPDANAFAVLRLERFPAWRVLLNGAPCAAACVAREDGLLTVHVPAGRWTTIEARYRATGDVWLGRAVSLISLTALLLLLWLGWPRASTQLS